jgi:dipeptidyl aminopeptidase/acylaminoacyl peptidase
MISNAQNYLWLVDVATGQRTALSERSGAPVQWISADFTPDGKTLYALSNLLGDGMHVIRREIGGAQWKMVTPERDSIEGFALSPDGQTMALVVDRGDSSELRLTDVSGKPRLTPTLPVGVIDDLIWHRTGKEIAFSHTGARSFHDVYSVNVATGKPERWTWSEIGGANPETLPEAEIVRWKSFDGLPISGVLYRPPARFTGPRPVIINVHGGPDQRERPRGLGRSNYFRNELGVAIVYPNVRGSSGFGRTFEQADNGLLRENAVKDIGALLDWIATQPSLDKNRVMIAGPSYGGYVALSAAILYGDRLRCVNPVFGITDFPSYLSSTDIARQANRNAEYGDPNDPATLEFLKRISPLTNVDKLKIPVYIVAGAKDTRVPVSQAESFSKALKANGTPVWYMVFQDAGHLQLTAPNNDYSFSAWVLFAQTYLLN